MNTLIIVLVFSFCVCSITSNPIGENNEAIRERRATSFVCSACPFTCPHGGACLNGNCVCLKPLQPWRPGDNLPTPVVRP